MKYFKKKSIIYLIPVIFIVSIIPLIVYLKKIKLGSFLAQYWTDNINMDFFSYYKAVWLIIAAIIGIILFFIYLSQNNKIKKTKYYIPIIIYAIFSLLSSMFSDTPYVAILGFPDRYEGLFVLISYMIILFLAINLINDKNTIKIILISLIISSLILAIQGILQYFGMDFFMSRFGRKLILPHEYNNLVNKLNFNFKGDIIYSTMFHPNYVGSYTAMLFNLMFALFILIKEKKYKIILGITSLIMFAYWLGSMSRAGMLGGGIALILLVILLRNHLKNNWKYLIAISLSFILIFIGMNIYSDSKVMEDLTSFNKETSIAINGLDSSGSLKNIILNKKELIFVMSDLILKVKLEDKKLKFISGNEKIIPYKYDKNTGNIEFLKNKYKTHIFTFLNNNNLLKWKYKNKLAHFTIKKNGFYILGHNNQAYNSLANVESWGFKGKEKLGSSRGYIWSRSLPLLKDTWFLGYGADTYAINFPQKDFLGKIIAYDRATIIVDKPHNMYLQTAINTGIPSLLALMALFIMYFYQSIKIYWKTKFNNLYSTVGVGIMVAFVGYAISGLFNDSVVSVAPVFWILLGMGISINLKLKNKF